MCMSLRFTVVTRVEQATRCYVCTISIFHKVGRKFLINWCEKLVPKHSNTLLLVAEDHESTQLSGQQNGGKKQARLMIRLHERRSTSS